MCIRDRLSAIGWLGLLGAAPFSIAYIVRACSEGVQVKVLSVFAGDVYKRQVLTCSTVVTTRFKSDFMLSVSAASDSVR